MTDDAPSTDSPGTNVEDRLAAALADAHAASTPVDRHRFLARAQVRRDALRRRRRVWTVATPLVAAAVVLVAVALVVQRGETPQVARGDSSASSTTATACPERPGTPDTEPGADLFPFVPTSLELCTYDTDGRLVVATAVPGPENDDVAGTLAYLQRAYVDTAPPAAEPHCGPGEIPIDRLGIFAFDGDDSRPADAWVPIAGCTTPPVASDTATTHLQGALADVQLTPDGDTVEVRTRASGSPSWGEPNRIETPKLGEDWIASAIGLEEVTVHIVVLTDGTTITNADELTPVMMGRPHCGSFTCAVFAVPRDSGEARFTVHVSAGGAVRSIELGSIPVGGGGVQFETSDGSDDGGS